MEYSNSNMVSEIIEALRSDLQPNTIEQLRFYQRITACNPKPFPISGLQHFIGTAILSLRLSEFKGLTEKDSLTAFLAGLLHDYEKMGYSKEDLLKGAAELLESSELYDMLTSIIGDKVLEEVWKNAVEIACKLESGGIPLRLQKIERLVRVSDYITGGVESWKISTIIDFLVREAGIDPKNILPVVFGKPRPIIGMVSEKIEEELEKAGAIPLVSTPEGMIFLLSAPEIMENVERIYESLSKYILSFIKEEGKVISRGLNYGSIRGFIEGKRKLATYSRAIKPITAYRPEDIEETYKQACRTEADLRYFIIFAAYMYSKDPKKGGTKAERIWKLLDNVEPKLKEVLKTRKVGDILIELHNALLNLKHDELAMIARKLKNYIVSEMSKEKAVSAKQIRILIEKLKTIVSIAGLRPSEKYLVGVKPCALCREAVVEGTTLYDYLQKISKIIRNLNVSDAFHPDLLGAPETKSLEGSSKKLQVCEICYFESIAFPEKVKFMDGLWSSTLIYFPAIPIDFMKIIKSNIPQIAVNISGREILVIPDYMTSRIIAKTSNDRGFMSKSDFMTALNLWYYFGGSLVISTVALSSGFVCRGMPIEIEKSDAVFEEAIITYIRILNQAKEERKWKWTRSIRLWLYETLKNYIESTEARKVIRGRKQLGIKLLKSGFITTGYPSIDTYAFFLRKKQL